MSDPSPGPRPTVVAHAGEAAAEPRITGGEAQHDDRLVVLHDQLLSYARDLRAALASNRAAAEELSRTHLETVAALAAAVDVRDEVTGGHVYRVANYGLVLAEHAAPDLATDPQLVFGFLLHDIGKLGVPDEILRKDGALSTLEEGIMRRHVEYGVRFVAQVRFLRPALHVVATHHEAYDGSGYPRGLAGDAIPLATRLFCVCDAFDAMVHDRPYRRAMDVEAAVAELRRGAGSQFDPAAVAGFEEVLDAILEVEDRPQVPHVAERQPRAPHSELASAAAVVLDALDDAVLLVSADGIVEDANARFIEWFGLPRRPVGMTLEELAERCDDRFADPAAAPSRSMRLTRELFQAASERTYELVRPQRRLVRRTARTLYDADAEPVGRLLILRDVSSTTV